MVGIAAYCVVIASIFPSIEGTADFDELLESYPDALKELFGIEEGSLTSGPGYLDAELFSLMLPLLVLVLAIGAGARAWAGEEEAGRLELVLAYPVRRRDALLAKAGALAAEVVVACGAAFVALAVMDAVVGLDLSLGRLAGAVGAVGLLGLLHGWLALAVGAAGPGRALAIGVPAALAAAAYLVGGLHELAGWLEPFRFGSSVWWIGSAPLRAGVSGWGVLGVAAAALAVLAAGAVLAERRDLRTA